MLCVINQPEIHVGGSYMYMWTRASDGIGLCEAFELVRVINVIEILNFSSKFEFILW